MAEIWYLRKLTGEACGPGSRNALNPAGGTTAVELALDATGDTWNRGPIFVEHEGLMYEPGTWSATLLLKRTSPTPATVNVVIARYSSGCVEQEQMVNANQSITTAGFAEYTFSGSAGLMAWNVGDLLMCIVKITTARPATIEYDQNPTFLPASRVALPDIRTVRPHEYYKRLRRRRAN